MATRQLNYKHLHYFHVVAREGSIIKAAKALHLTPQTISGQLTQLEEALDLNLFVKVGRSLRLTPSGQMVLGYTTQIFSLGDQLMGQLQDQYSQSGQRITIGILDSIPKIIAYAILKPLLENPLHTITCIEGDIERLMADLAIHKLDMVLADVPLNPAFSIKARSYLLGESTLSCFAVSSLAAKYRRGFPDSLAGAPMLLPRESSYMGRELHKWLQSQSWHYQVRGYFDDSALLKVFGQAGEGLFFMPSAIEKEICSQFGVKIVGRIDNIREHYYAIRTHRALKNPALDMLCETARTTIFRS
jgi:LysR family transcriptional activator of nhaA